MRLLLFFSAAAAIAAPAVTFNNIPLSFEPGTGQSAAEVRYIARGSAWTLYMEPGETVLAKQNQPALRTKWTGASRSARMAGEDQQGATSNYFIGPDPAKWRTAVPNYSKVRYLGLYPGIDLVYYGKQGKLEYDWVVSPGADPRKIRMNFEGANRVRIDSRGDLVIRLGKFEYRHGKPVVYQEAAGRRVAVAGSWTLDGQEAGFRIGEYDRAKPLVIDPPLVYATYQGGSGMDYAYGVAVDGAGNTYITGGAGSTDFPTAGALQASLKGLGDVFVVKINAAGTARVYSTYLGGSGVDEGRGIAVDSAGNAYVTGTAGSLDFPTLGAPQPTGGRSGDAFVAKINPAGSALVYSTYLGGLGQDYGNGIAVDSSGNAYVVGVTNSTDFPTHFAFQASKGAQDDAFVAKINAAGNAWVYSTYLGGNNEDQGNGIAVDAAGNAYVTGYTVSTNFPLQSPLRSSNAASVDAFVTKINPAGSALVYSTYLGGSATDYGTALAVDSSGSAYVTGIVTSDDFPVVGGFDSRLASHAIDDVFVTKFNPSGSALVYSTYLGGGSVDDPYAIALDAAGDVYVGGRTNSSDFPLTNPIQSTRFAFDMFLTEINAAGSARLFSTFIGGTGSESVRGIAVDTQGNVHVAGESDSTDFPVQSAIQPANGGTTAKQDAIVMMFGAAPSQSLRFVPLPPCRVADTRLANDPFGGPLLAAGTSRDFVIPNSTCGVPANAQAYAINVSVVPPGPLGYLTVWPTGQPQPLASTLNSVDGRIKGNAAISPAGAGGAISVYVTNATDVILDINGYFVSSEAANALEFYPLTPCRVADTRNAPGALGGPFLSARVGRSFPILSSTCGIPSTAQAYSLNFAAVPQGSLGYVTTWPTGQQQPLVSTLNALGGQITANAAIVPAGANGQIDVFASDNTDMVIDINGYFAPAAAGGLSLYAVTPCRVLDSRIPAGTPPFSDKLDVNVTASPCSVPANAQAFVFSAAVVPPGPLGYMTLWPQGQAQPLVSTLNALDGVITSNMAIVPAANGGISVFPSNPTHLVLDISGYFAQ